MRILLYTFVILKEDRMVKYHFYQSAALSFRPHIEKMNFLYHINLFDWPIEHGHSDYWEFTIVTGGTIDNCCNGKVRTYGVNSVFKATTQDVHRLLAAGTEPVRYINIMVREPYLQALLDALEPGLFARLLADTPRVTLSASRVSEIEQILLQVNYSNSDQYRENDALICSAFLLLLSAVIQRMTVAPLKVPPALEQLNRLTQSNELLTCNVNDLCRLLGYSRVQLNTVFKKHFGITPHKYLIDYKFTYAGKLLLNTNKTVTEIAYTIGYSNPMQFYATFKKLFSLTPDKYRKLGHAEIPQTDQHKTM